ncbi:MAG: hypothetical protein AB8B94_08520 [Hyphomicrobiales bacterium]
MIKKEIAPQAVTEVITPLTFTDWVKASREALALLRDIGSMVGSVSGAYQQHQGRKAADQIDMIAFGEDGSRKHLERIASGNANSEDFQAIVQKMDETGEQVEQALDKINKSRDFVRKRFGAQLANTIDRLIYAGQGKQSIRMDLTMLANMDLTFYSADQIAAEAQNIMSNIQALNDELAEVHDILAGIDNT